MNIEMRFKEANFLDRAAARLIELPRAITRMEHPANPGTDWDGIADAFFGHKHGDLSTLRDHNEELLALVSALRERIAYLEAEVARLERLTANG